MTISYFVRETRLYDSLTQMGRWFGYRAGYEDLVRVYTSSNINTWLYRFDWSSPEGIFGACHCIELPFIFDTAVEWDPPMLLGGKVKEIAGLSGSIH